MQGIVTFVGDLRFALFALTGGDEYYTVGGAATIDGCGRCIFQYFHGNDVCRVDGTEHAAVAGVVA